MDLEALAAFLTRQGLSLRSAHVTGDEVTSFTCDPAPSPAAEQPSEPAPRIVEPAPEPDGLGAYLAMKKQGSETP